VAKVVSAPAQGIDDFRATYDKNVIVPNKIKAGLEKLLALRADGTAWATDVNFLKTAGLSTTDLARFREQFVEFQVNVGTDRQPKWVWFGSKKAAAKAREAVPA
jgi:hypothetical protein